MTTNREHKKEVVNLLSNIILYTISGILGMIVLALLTRVNLFGNIRIYYYRMIGNAILTVVIIMIVLFLVRKFIDIKMFKIELTTIFSTCALVGMALILFISIGPMTIDRSYTIFSLADMTENEDTVFSAEEIEDRFSDIYIYQYGSIEKRIEEQLSIGNIVETEEGYKISEKGKQLVGIFRLVEKIYPVEDKRIIYPVYGDGQNEKN